MHSHFFGQSSFATGAIIPERSVVAIPDDVPFEVVAPFGCGMQTGVGGVMNVLRPLPNSSIAIFGAGGVGLSAVMAAVICGCSPIIAVDVRPGRLALAQELGATHVVDARKVDPVEAVAELTGGGVEASLETSGVPGCCASPSTSLGPTGRAGSSAPRRWAPRSRSTSTACCRGAAGSRASSRATACRRSSSPS